MRSTKIDEPAFDALRRCEEATAALEANPSDGGLAAAFRLAQAGLRRALGEEARGAAERWRISDLVTIGSPLTHAEFLLGSGLDDLARRKVERELPTAPPYRERLDEGVLELAKKANLILPEDEDPRLFSFPNAGASDRWQMHQGAAFAAVRWSNVHDPARHIYRGDMISGELGSIFGAGVEDVDLSKVRGHVDYFSHMRYWSEKAPKEQLVKLRAVLNLLDA